MVSIRVDTKFCDTKFRKHYFRISRNGHIICEISRNFEDEYREISQKLGQNFAKICQFGGLGLGHAPNQIGQD
jgi:hypothetical protein